MSVSVSVNGTSYTIPESGETDWGSQVTSWIQAVSSHTLQKSGGTFTLTAETDLGATYGLKSAYFKSRGTNLSSAGILRLANAESIGWRNAANSADKLLKVNASNELEYDGTALETRVTTTKGDIIARSSSANSRLAVGTNGHVLTADSTESLGIKWAVPTTKDLTIIYASKSANYTVTSTDDFIDCSASGGNITMTLPTAVGIQGKIYRFRKSESSTNTVTIDGNASETIDGSTSVKLCTDKEELAIVSDGANWIILDHKCNTSFQTFTMTITADTSNPSKGTVDQDLAKWRRVGNCMEIYYGFRQTGAGSAGTGEYRFAIPSGYTIDTTQIPNEVSGNGQYGICGSARVGDSGSTAWGFPYVFSSSLLKLRAGNASVNLTSIGSTSFAALSDASAAISFHAIIPITDWLP